MYMCLTISTFHTRQVFRMKDSDPIEIFMPMEWNLGSSCFWPVCDSVCENTLILLITFEI